MGEAGIRLCRNPDTSVSVDVCYVSADVANASPDDDPFLDGAPLSVVEVPSPCIAATPRRTPPHHFNETQMIDGEPHLPSFRVATSPIFAR